MNKANVTAVCLELQSLIKQELRPGEDLVWIGTPDPIVFARNAAYLRIVALFSYLGSIVICVYWGIQNHLSTRPGWPPIFVLLFGCWGLIVSTALVIGPGWLMKRKAARTVCGLTAQRAIIVEVSWKDESRSVSSYDLNRLQKMTRKEYADGGGDLIFEMIRVSRSEQSNSALRPIGCLGIKDVRGVEKTLRKYLECSQNHELSRP